MEALWQQQTLLQLLQTVELPMLDRILSSPPRAPGQARRALGPGQQDLVISNTCLERELHQMLHLPQSVVLVSVLVSVLDVLPVAQQARSSRVLLGDPPLWCHCWDPKNTSPFTRQDVVS